MNIDPTASTVLAAFLAGNDSFDVYAEDGSVHVGTVDRGKATPAAADAVMTLELATGAAKGRPSGRFLIAVRRLDPDNPADVALTGGK